MKKTVSLILALFLVLSLLAGCDSKPEGDNPSTTAPKGGTVHLLPDHRGEAINTELGQTAPAAEAGELLNQLLNSGYHSQVDPSWLEDNFPAEPAVGTGYRIQDVSPESAVAADGDYIYAIDSYGLVILSAKGAKTEQISYTKIPRNGTGWTQRLYVLGNRAALLYSVSEAGIDQDQGWYDVAETRLALVDITDRSAPVLLGETAVGGSLLDSRLVGDTLCLAAQRNFWTLEESTEPASVLPWVEEGGAKRILDPWYVFQSPNPSGPAYTLAAAISMQDGSLTDLVAFTDGSDAVCIGPEGVTLARVLHTETASEPAKEGSYQVVRYESKAQTEIRRLGLRNGRFTLAGGCVLDGALLSSLSMDVSDGQLRAACTLEERSYASYTDDAHGWTNYERLDSRRTDRVTLLDQELKALGTLDLGESLRLRDCRFLGKLGCALTNESKSPLRLIDLSNALTPALGGSLNPAGVSVYLLPFGENRLLALGDPVEADGLNLSLYDASNPAEPQELARQFVGDYRWSAELFDPGCLLAEGETGLLSLPVEGLQPGGNLLLSWNGGEFEQKGALALDFVPANTRMLLLDGLLYLCSPGVTHVIDPNSGKLLNTISNAVG